MNRPTLTAAMLKGRSMKNVRRGLTFNATPGQRTVYSFQKNALTATVKLRAMKGRAPLGLRIRRVLVTSCHVRDIRAQDRGGPSLGWRTIVATEQGAVFGCHYGFTALDNLRRERGTRPFHYAAPLPAEQVMHQGRTFKGVETLSVWRAAEAS